MGQAFLKLCEDLQRLGDPQKAAADSIEILTSEEESIIRQPRASSIYDGCLRQNVLCTLTKKKAYRRLTFDSLLTFAIGNAVHEYLQNHHNIFGDRRFGLWKCTACQTVHPFGPPHHEPCPVCKAHPEAIRYQEVFFNFPSICGHPDAFLQDTQIATITLVEFKTIKMEEFEKLAAPLISHRWQVIAYLLMLRKLKKHFPVSVNINHADIYYFSKGMKKNEFPVKKYIIRFDEEIAEGIKAKLSYYRKCVESKGKLLPPPHEDCLRYNGKAFKFRECPVSKKCFGEEK